MITQNYGTAILIIIGFLTIQFGVPMCVNKFAPDDDIQQQRKELKNELHDQTRGINQE
jgi:hypothetical protein